MSDPLRWIVAALRHSGVTTPRAEALAGAAHTSAAEQHTVVAGEATTAELIRELATYALRTRERIQELDQR